jgi:hypothetical protein
VAIQTPDLAFAPQLFSPNERHTTPFEVRNLTDWQEGIDREFGYVFLRHAEQGECRSIRSQKAPVIIHNDNRV